MSNSKEKYKYLIRSPEPGRGRAHIDPGRSDQRVPEDEDPPRVSSVVLSPLLRPSLGSTYFSC